MVNSMDQDLSGKLANFYQILPKQPNLYNTKYNVHRSTDIKQQRSKEAPPVTYSTQPWLLYFEYCRGSTIYSPYKIYDLTFLEDLTIPTNLSKLVNLGSQLLKSIKTIETKFYKIKSRATNRAKYAIHARTIYPCW